MMLVEIFINLTPSTIIYMFLQIAFLLVVLFNFVISVTDTGSITCFNYETRYDTVSSLFSDSFCCRNQRLYASVYQSAKIMVNKVLPSYL